MKNPKPNTIFPTITRKQISSISINHTHLQKQPASKLNESTDQQQNTNVRIHDSYTPVIIAYIGTTEYNCIQKYILYIQIYKYKYI